MLAVLMSMKPEWCKVNSFALGKYHTEPCKTWKKCHAFRVRIC